MPTLCPRTEKNTALARPQPHKPNASSVFYGIAAVCNCHTFCVVFANAPQHIAILVPAVAKSCPTSKNKAKSHFTPTTTTVPFMPVCKSVEAILHNVALFRSSCLYSNSRCIHNPVGFIFYYGFCFPFNTQKSIPDGIGGYLF